jgi:hypothetical protein
VINLHDVRQKLREHKPFKCSSGILDCGDLPWVDALVVCSSQSASSGMPVVLVLLMHACMHACIYHNTCIHMIGASLSEPHINESTLAPVYILLLLFWYVRHAIQSVLPVRRPLALSNLPVRRPLALSNVPLAHAHALFSRASLYNYRSLVPRSQVRG